MRSVTEYLGLIPPLNANKPNFNATIAATVATFADNQSFLNDLWKAFDLDVAVGVQLDAVGAWAGISRIIPIPVIQPWFSWGINKRGWGQAYWKGPDLLKNSLSSLDDETYRRLIRAKIVANYSAGQIAGAQAALSTFFLPPTLIFTMDRTQAIPFGSSQKSSGMEWQVGVSGKIPSLVELEILAQNLIPVAPAAVNFDVKVITVDNTPLFGWGVDNQYIGGWGVGSWGASPDYVVKNILDPLAIAPVIVPMIFPVSLTMDYSLFGVSML